MVGSLNINEAKNIRTKHYKAEPNCAESLRNYPSLLPEIITFLDYFNDKNTRAKLHKASTTCKTPNIRY